MHTFGIDLGTTYSCIAYIDQETGRAVIAKNSIGEETTPSVVYFESQDNVVVGRTAKESALLLPNQVAWLIKRSMGEEVTFNYLGQEYTPQSISAIILRYLADAASAETGEPVRDVVITVPAYFGQAETEATKAAGTIAGLNVLATVQEPVAAALHYGAIQGEGDRSILVYDLGGGTFDTTVIKMSGHDIQVVCTGGDHKLGGAEWDEAISGYLLDEFEEANPGIDARSDEEFLQEVAKAAEQLKKDLSLAQSRKQNLRFAGGTAQIELTRDTFEALTSHLLQRTIDHTKATVELARERGIDRFDDVLLVGGSSRMPVVARTLREEFGFEARLTDPDLAVAKGAALYSMISWLKEQGAGEGSDGDGTAALEDAADRAGLSLPAITKLAETRVTTVVPRAFGVKVIDSNDPELKREFVSHLLHANDQLPKSTGPQSFSTVVPNQTGIRIEVWEQAGTEESPKLEHNGMIGEGIISGLPPLPAGSPLTVTFDMDALGNLHVHAVEQSTGKELRLDLVIGGLDAKQVEDDLAIVGPLTVSG